MTFGRQTIEQRQAQRQAQKTANLQALATVPARSLHRGTYSGNTSGQPVEKDEPAKPGKRTPTAEERAWMDWIVAYGCIACKLDGLGFRPPAVHHILRGGQRIGHLSTLPLCDPGHHQNGQQFGMVSRHPWKSRFEERYGSEASLLALLRAIYQGERHGQKA
jgi:hypothetical protein